MSQSLALILPMYNEAEGLALLLPRLEAVAERLEREAPLQVSFIFVDDGSADDTAARLAAHPFTRPARLIRFSRNFGKEAALSAGIAACEADAAVVLDADLQHPPEMISDFVRLWRETGADSVYAYKATRLRSEGAAKTLLARLFFKVINWGARYDIPENAGDFRLMTRRFMAALSALPESERFMKGLYGWIGFTQVGLPYTPAPRAFGTTRFSPLRLFAMSFDALTSFTTAPLRLMTLTGFLIAFLSGCYGLFIICERLFVGASTWGTPSVLALVAFFGGMNMIFLGLLGEYVGKAVSEAKKRPPFVVAEDTRLGGGA